MFDQFTPRGRILAAALDCATRKSWGDVTLLDIGEAAKLPLADLRKEFESKTDIVAALVRAIDDEVLKRAVHVDPAKRYTELSEFVYDLRHPNAAYLSRTRAPLLERNPVAFWRGVSMILAIILAYVLLRG